MYHIRFTPDDISGYTFTFLETYERYIVAYEDKDKTGAKCPPHYHIYIDTTYGKESVRNAVKTSLKIPASGRGKNNKYYALYTDWKDKDYIFKWGDIRHKKGFSEEEILLRVEMGRKKYLRLNGEGELSGEAPAPSNKVVRVSDKLIIADLDCWYIDQKKQFGSVDTKEMIKQANRIVLSYGKGINLFKIRDYIHSVWFIQEKWDDPKADMVVNKIFTIL